MKIFHSTGHIVGGTLLVAGTTIGVGMLALPVATGPAGFFPSLFVYCACWLFMVCTGLLLVEVSLWLPKETSFISMADKLLGPFGKIVFWLMYLFLFITVLIAHIAGGSEVVRDLIGKEAIPSWIAAIVYTAVFAPVVYLGARFVDRLNLILISGVAICYLAFIVVSAKSVEWTLLQYSNWSQSWSSLPIVFTAFTYQVIIPSLVTYLERNVRKIRIAILSGSAIPFIIYLVWEFLILGIVPVEGSYGLLEAKALGQNAVAPLRYFVADPLIFGIGKYFAFFALTTSFIPLALSFFDFLADGFHWKKKGMRKVCLCAIVFGLPLAIALKYPQIFLIALGYAGGVSCSFLFGLMPPLMVWIGRYHSLLPQRQKQLFGGKTVLLILIVFAFIVFVGHIKELL